MSKDNLFRKKKEMQRLATDYEEDHRRLAQIQSKTSRADKQKEHLESAKAAVDEEILTQQVQLDELSEKIRRLVLQHRGNGAELSSLTEEKDRGAGASSAPENKNAALSIEEKAVKAEVYRDVIQVGSISITIFTLRYNYV